MGSRSWLRSRTGSRPRFGASGMLIPAARLEPRGMVRVETAPAEAAAVVAAAAVGTPKPAATTMAAATPSLDFLNHHRQAQQKPDQAKHRQLPHDLLQSHDAPPFFLDLAGLDAGGAAFFTGINLIFWAPGGGAKVNRLSASWGAKFQSEK